MGMLVCSVLIDFCEVHYLPELMSAIAVPLAYGLFACRRPLSKDVFLKHFWDCFATFEQHSSERAGMPAYFRFLTLLGAPFSRLSPALKSCNQSP